VALPLGDAPCHIDYTVAVDAGGQATEAQATITTPSGVRKIVLRSGAAGGWDLDGVPAPQLERCGDIDLGWTPATNTIPIRRLGLAIGESATITAAWIRFPELDVVANEQHYTRLANDRWRYRSGVYDFDLATDPTSRLVVAYGVDLWRATAISHG
jgi:uncharacterized protein